MQSQSKALNARVLLIEHSSSGCETHHGTIPLRFWPYSSNRLRHRITLHIVGNWQARVDILWRLVWSQRCWPSHKSEESPGVHLCDRGTVSHALKQEFRWHIYLK